MSGSLHLSIQSARPGRLHVDNFISPSQYSYWVGTVTLSVLRRKKPRLGEIKQLVQDHTGGKYQKHTGTQG